MRDVVLSYPSLLFRAFPSSSYNISRPCLWFLLLLTSCFLIYMTTKEKKGASKQACAACRHQRRKCANDCRLAPYFPADQYQNFLNAHRLFGVGNIMRILKQVPDDQKQDTVKSIVYESNLRAVNPVLGAWGMVLQLQRRFQGAMEELQQVKAQLAVFRNQVPPPPGDLGIVKTNSAIQICDYQNPEGLMKPEQQHYFDKSTVFSQGFSSQSGLFAAENIPVDPPLFVSEGIPVQPPLLVSQGMSNLLGNHDLMSMVADERKHYSGSKGGYYVDKSLNRIAGDIKHYSGSRIVGDVKPYLGSIGGYGVDKSLDGLSGDDIKQSTESKGACDQPRKVELLHAESKNTGEKERDKGQQGSASKLIKGSNRGSALHTEAEDCEKE